MTRNGKIARLPCVIRKLLNRRLRDGECGSKLVVWLNGLPAVQENLRQNFGGRAISEQNLSEWKQGGYQEWLQQEEAREWVRSLSEDSEALEDEAGDLSVADLLSAPLAVAIGRQLQNAGTAPADDPAHARVLLELARELAQLRRLDHSRDRLRIERERWEVEQEKDAGEELAKLREALTHAEVQVEVYGAILEEHARKQSEAPTLDAGAQAKLQSTLSALAEWRRRTAVRKPDLFEDEVPARNGPSNSIKPDQARSSLGEQRSPERMR